MHVIHSINMTLSGRADPRDAVVDAGHLRYARELVAGADALVLGRTTFDVFDAFWPQATTRDDLPGETLALALALQRIDKLVVSSRAVDTAWANTVHVRGPDLDALGTELARRNGTAIVFGSPALAASLRTAGLVDELHLLVQPFIGVDGPRAFPDAGARSPLDLLECRALGAGSVLLRYAVTGAQHSPTPTTNPRNTE